jgi:predicted nucleic-acid-binding protein
MIKAFIDTSAILRLLVKDDELKSRACEKLIRESKTKGVELYIIPVTILEIVWVLEKVYAYSRHTISDIVTAILNTPQLKVVMESTIRKALTAYDGKNIKFADALMAYWGLESGVATVYTYDDKHFKRIDSLIVKTP